MDISEWASYVMLAFSFWGLARRDELMQLRGRALQTDSTWIGLPPPRASEPFQIAIGLMRSLLRPGFTFLWFYFVNIKQKTINN
jgi:hypothetical protein